jgi:hypothetical protein
MLSVLNATVVALMVATRRRAPAPEPAPAAAETAKPAPPVVTRT